MTDNLSALYLEECTRLCIEPLDYLMALIDSQPEAIKLSRTYIGDKHAIALAAVIPKLSLKELALPFNGIMNYGTLALVRALKGTRLQRLDLSRNDFSPSCVGEICSMILDTPSLQEV